MVAIIWKIFKYSPLGRVIRFLAPQKMVNILEHFPMAVLANICHLFPSKKITVIGVTGTDGKTTTVNMIYKILKDARKNVSMVSTINAVIGDQSFDTGFHVTSPHSFTIQEFIKRAKNNGSEYIVLEVTSHALDQFRFWGVKFDIGVITNITHEHLDYHKTWENYLKTKGKLIKNVKIAVLNKGEQHYQKLTNLTKGKIVSFGLTKGADFNPTRFPLKLKIIGDFNLLNALAAAAVCVNLGIDSKIIKQSLANFVTPKGRMEEIENDLGIKIYIDFAHTPNGLTQALTALKKITKGNLISVIGSEGFRDVGKRSILGEVAQKLSDYVVVTAVDPRGQLETINRQIKKGALKSGAKEGKNFFIIDDRLKAIKFAIGKLAKKGDTVGMFGKGHEVSINVDGKKEIPWSDYDAVKKALMTSA